MSRTVDLWQYLPPFLKDFKELRNLLSAEQPEFQTLAEELDALRDDFFIQTASEKGIVRYEKLLKIHPGITETLESRRANVLARWYDAMPFTVRALKKRISIIQGNENVNVSFDEDDPFHILIETNMETAGQVDSLAYILETMLPANLSFSSQNMIRGTVNIRLGYAVGSAIAGSLFLTNDLDTNMNKMVSLGVCAAGAITGQFFYTNDLDCNVEIGEPLFVGMANSITVFIDNP